MEVVTLQGSRSVTVSIGATSNNGSSKHPQNVDVLIKQADQALCGAKNAGRNRIKLWQDLDVSKD